MTTVDLARRATASMSGLLAQISADQYALPTPCADWSVGDLVTHVLAGNVKYVDIARGGNWFRGVPQIEVAEDAAAMYRATAEEMLRAWEEPGALDRQIDLPRGRSPSEGALQLHLAETLVHGWDLAVATGVPATFDDDAAEASLAHYRTWLPPERPAQLPFADATELPAGAPALRRLAAYLGRDVKRWS